MKYRLTLLLALSLVCFSCGRDQDTKAKVSGTFSAGSDLAPSELGDIKIYLGQYSGALDFSEITPQTDDITLIDSVYPDQNGYYEFTELEPGNYSLIPEPGYIFALDTLHIFRLEKYDEVVVNRTIERMPEENLLVILVAASTNSNWKFSICNKLPSFMRLDSCRISANGVFVASASLSNPGYRSDYVLNYPDDAVNYEIQFVLFNQETGDYIDSPVFRKPVDSDQVPVTVGPVKINYRLKWLWNKFAFFFEMD